MSSVLLRLTDAERETLKVLNAALKVSEYTDDVDNIRSYQRFDVMMNAMNELFRTLIGLTQAGRSLPADALEILEKNPDKPASFAPVLGPSFEVGRRFKRLNPDKMRSEYGKLLMLLQDMGSRRIESRIGDLKRQVVLPCQTVGDLLHDLGAEKLLHADELEIATAYLTSRKVKYTAAEKEEARNTLIQRFGGEDESKKEGIERCIRSIDDAHQFVASNVECIEQLKVWLKQMFTADGKDTNLAIRSGSNGSKLSHSHADHQQYVLESLTLWGIIQRDIFDFWQVVEEDMVLSGADYRFVNTGQGYNRVVAGPKTFSRMQKALAEAKAAMGGRWVGISVVHLGDQDVPNALVFIDKYTIIPKLLSPIVHTINEIDHIFADEGQTYPGLRNLLKAKFGSGEALKKLILQDFFRHGFDGSGDDGGSCIDGRLTSAWNWSSLLHKKSYYDAFVLTGFTGFDSAYN